NIVQDFKQWQSGRLLALYTEIKPWTELILSEYMPVSTQGNWYGMSLLFPMEKLFEHYVAYHDVC
ncbi:restriction endonuclease, partial [Acinetobacter baumannii]